MTMKTVALNDLEIGKAYNVVRATNAHGEFVRSIRRGDWRAVLITAEALASYKAASETYYFQPIKDRYTPRLLAAGYVRFSFSRGECGAEIVTKGPLLGLACKKPALWARNGSIPACAQHAALEADV